MVMATLVPWAIYTRRISNESQCLISFMIVPGDIPLTLQRYSLISLSANDLSGHFTSKLNIFCLSYIFKLWIKVLLFWSLQLSNLQRAVAVNITILSIFYIIQLHSIVICLQLSIVSLPLHYFVTVTYKYRSILEYYVQ